MIKVSAANVIVSKGYNDTDAVKFNKSGDCAMFRISEKKYDSREEDNTRWINVNVKALGGMAERVKKMKLGAGSNVVISGDLDIETWEDENSNKKSMAVILLTHIEYQFGGSNNSSKSKNDDEDEEEEEQPKPKAKGKSSGKKNPEDSDNFEGYQGFGDFYN